MTAKAFFDTNVLVYAAIGNGPGNRKRKRALALIDSEDFGTSAQVLQEFFVTVVKKASRPLSAAEALDWIEQWTAFPCQVIDQRLVRVAVEYSERYRISFWDAAHSRGSRGSWRSHGLLGRPQRRAAVRTAKCGKPFLLVV
jgi:predicted nucleic acid-binding protein